MHLNHYIYSNKHSNVRARIYVRRLYTAYTGKISLLFSQNKLKYILNNESQSGIKT